MYAQFCDWVYLSSKSKKKHEKYCYWVLIIMMRWWRSNTKCKQKQTLPQSLWSKSVLHVSLRVTLLLCTLVPTIQPLTAYDTMYAMATANIFFIFHLNSNQKTKAYIADYAWKRIPFHSHFTTDKIGQSVDVSCDARSSSFRDSLDAYGIFKKPTAKW